jgi:hypothetical protein
MQAMSPRARRDRRPHGSIRLSTTQPYAAARCRLVGRRARTGRGNGPNIKVDQYHALGERPFHAANRTAPTVHATCKINKMRTTNIVNSG